MGTTYDVGIVVVVVDVIKVGTVGRISTVEVGEKPVRSTQCIIIFAFYVLVNDWFMRRYGIYPRCCPRAATSGIFRIAS